METILLSHATRYPLMEPRDAVKLVFQNEFGGGHLIRDEKNCLEFLRKEYESVSHDSGIPLLEDIGNGLCRVHLAALDAHGFSAAELGRAFLRSSACHGGTMDSFRKKLAVLTELTVSGRMPFSPEALQACLTDYEKAGFPPVSHSDAYRSAYIPAYRVVRTECLPPQIARICFQKGGCSRD